MCVLIYEGLSTVFPRKDAAATIYFVVGIGAVFNQGWLVFEGGVYLFSALNVGVASTSIECSTHGSPTFMYWYTYIYS